MCSGREREPWEERRMRCGIYLEPPAADRSLLHRSTSATAQSPPHRPKAPTATAPRRPEPAASRNPVGRRPLRPQPPDSWSPDYWRPHHPQALASAARSPLSPASRRPEPPV
ncbi:hypothetical protein GUJ93_ZPchr0008g11528 [Zizania palustris]|uniref:Uncharacterized protein n=1 Tax=Zizania palustris TaxID=103762 RepID=A0A8J5RJ28_ZIZPA|nr:hypothetical protein GUJ93_ZPchr0008g11528 [Zizania palustris]